MPPVFVLCAALAALAVAALAALRPTRDGTLVAGVLSAHAILVTVTEGAAVPFGIAFAGSCAFGVARERLTRSANAAAPQGRHGQQ